MPTKTKKMSSEMLMLLKNIYTEKRKLDAKDGELQSITARLNTKLQKLETMEKKERYFFDNLYEDTTFENDNTYQDLAKYLPDLATDYKRTVVIYRTFDEYLKKNSIANVYTLNKDAVAKIIRIYMDDLAILKVRYGCNTIQLPKIAGLMTNLIAKYRPVVPIDRQNNPIANINEVFAIHHALCICSDFSDGSELKTFEKSLQYKDFFDDAIYLLDRNYTSEGLILAFKTLCLYQFKSFKTKKIHG